jgi:poly(A) polymerase
MPQVAELCPLVPATHLEQAHDAVFPLVGKICEQYQISSHIRHMARELIISCYRLSRGRSYKAKGKFSKRNEFPTVLDFYGAWVEGSGSDDEALTYWRSYLTEKQGERAPSKKKRRRRGRRSGKKPGASVPVTSPEE